MRLRTCEDVPGSHLLVKAADVVGKLLAARLHLIDVDFVPRRRLPVVDARQHDV